MYLFAKIFEIWSNFMSSAKILLTYLSPLSALVDVINNSAWISTQAKLTYSEPKTNHNISLFSL